MTDQEIIESIGTLAGIEVKTINPTRPGVPVIHLITRGKGRNRLSVQEEDIAEFNRFLPGSLTGPGSSLVVRLMVTMMTVYRMYQVSDWSGYPGMAVHLMRFSPLERRFTRVFGDILPHMYSVASHMSPLFMKESEIHA